MGKKKEGTVRILFQNIGGLGENKPKSSYKLDKLKKTVLANEVDIYGMAEVNTDWRLIDTENTLWNRTKGWHKHRKISLSHNEQGAKISPFQVRGTATITANEVACRVIEFDNDFRHLGRWSTTLLQGKGNIRTRIVTAYCPVKSYNVGGTYAQQLQGLALDGIVDRCPKEVF